MFTVRLTDQEQAEAVVRGLRGWQPGDVARHGSLTVTLVERVERDDFRKPQAWPAGVDHAWIAVDATGYYYGLYEDELLEKAG